MSTTSQFPVLLNVEVVENDNTYSIEADITGYQKDKVSVAAWNDSLTIQMQTSLEPNQKSFYLGEVESETYRRVIPLGFEVHKEDLQTEYHGGKLTVVVAKPTHSNAMHTERTVIA